SSVVVGASPVVPDTTRPSQPASTSRLARLAAASRSSEPSFLNGVTIAVSTVPSWAVTSNPPVLTGVRVPARPPDSVVRMAPAASRFGGQWAGGHFGAVSERRDLEVGEGRRGDLGQPTQTFDGQPPDLQISLFAGPHRDEMP